MTHDSINNLTTAGADTPQRKLGKYLLQRLLGRGGMGEVWLARDTLADIEVALKMLPPELRHSEEAQDQIRSSYQRVHRLGHPNICAVKDLVTDPGTGYFLVMDYFEGVTLSKYRAKQGWMTVEEVVRLLTPVAQALDYAHGLKLAHRDIKPGNILVSEDGQQVRVIDFQLASDIRASVSRLPNAPVNTSGTYPYMAPEQFLGQRASAQTDLYALAMVAYELLDGQLPYEAHSWDQWKSIVTDERSVLPKIEDIPETAQLSLESGLSRDLAKRVKGCERWLKSLEDSALSSAGETKQIAPGDTVSGTALAPGPDGPEISRPAEPGASALPLTEPAAPAPMNAPFSATEARTGQEAWAKYLGQDVVEKNIVGMEMTLIPPGEFLMGSSKADVTVALTTNEDMRSEYMDNERPQHPVRLVRPFLMGTHPVTQREFLQIMGRDPSYFGSNGSGAWMMGVVDSLRCPIESVTWFDAVEFCNKLSIQDELPPFYSLSSIQRESNGSIKSATVTVSGRALAPGSSAVWSPASDTAPAVGPANSAPPEEPGASALPLTGYRLPTEAEWEYACRAGTTTAFHFGNVLNGDKANIDGTHPFGTSSGPYLARTEVVGSYPANAYGLRDTCGNVWEWCHDGYDENIYSQKLVIEFNPSFQAPKRPVIRGGSFLAPARLARSATRDAIDPGTSGSLIGFRVVRTP